MHSAVIFFRLQNLENQFSVVLVFELKAFFNKSVHLILVSVYVIEFGVNLQASLRDNIDFQFVFAVLNRLVQKFDQLLRIFFYEKFLWLRPPFFLGGLLFLWFSYGASSDQSAIFIRIFFFKLNVFFNETVWLRFWRFYFWFLCLVFGSVIYD